jgi:hypothetical protein
VIDILYVSHNRLRMTEASFEALLENTDWSEVARLFIADDGSEDGTYEYLELASEQRCPVEVEFAEKPFGGPVAATNWYLDRVSDDVQTMAKIDNDFVVCPGWLGDMLKTMTLHPELDILGFEPFVGNPTMPPFIRGIRLAPHIGGKGLIRLRTFAHCRPRPGGLNGYFGFTEFQTKHEHITKAWVTPDLPCFGLDQLPFEPWTTLTQQYVERGWQRFWPPYDVNATDYWDWWLEAKDAEKVPA